MGRSLRRSWEHSSLLTRAQQLPSLYDDSGRAPTPRARLARRGLPHSPSCSVSATLRNTAAAPHQERRPWELPYHRAQSTPRAGGQPVHRSRGGRRSPSVTGRYARVTDHGVQQYVQSMDGRAGGLPHGVAPTSHPSTDATAPPCAAASTAGEHGVVPLVGWRPHRRLRPGRGHHMSAQAARPGLGPVPRGRTANRRRAPGTRYTPTWAAAVLPRPDQTGQRRSPPAGVSAPAAPTNQDRQRRAAKKCGITRGGSGADGPARPRSRPRRPTTCPRRPTPGGCWPRGWWPW